MSGAIPRRATIAAVLLVVAGASASRGPSTDPVSTPFHVIRHEAAAQSPIGLGTGVVQMRERCLYLGESHLLVWPATIDVSTEQGAFVLVADGWSFRVG